MTPIPLTPPAPLTPEALADLVTLINLKRAFNRTRGTRHGGLSV